MTDEQLRKLEELAAIALVDGPMIAQVRWLEMGQANADYVAAAWNAVQFLVAEIRRLRGLCHEDQSAVDEYNIGAQNRF